MACPNDSPLSEKKLITLKDLKNTNIFLLDPNSSLNVQMRYQDILIKNMGMDHIKFVQDFLAMDIYVKAGWGYGVLPNFIVDGSAKDISYIPIDYHDISPYGIAYMASFTNESILKQVVKILRETITEFLPRGK